MATEIYLGNPPQHIKEWIIAHSKPVASPKTKITFADGSKGEYLIEGVMDCPALIAAGLMPPGSGTGAPPSWIKQPVKAEIGSAVTSIGNNAFSSCSGLTSVTIPDSVTNIMGSAFTNCSGLTSMTIPDSVTIIGSEAFAGCSGLTSVTIGNGVTIIVEYAFYGCSSLTSVVVEGRTTDQARTLLANAGLSDINIVTGSIQA